MATSASHEEQGEVSSKLSAKYIRNANYREKRRVDKLAPSERQVEILEQAVRSGNEELAFECGVELSFLLSSEDGFNGLTEEQFIPWSTDVINIIVVAMKTFPMIDSLSKFGCEYLGQTADRYSYHYNCNGGSYSNLERKMKYLHSMGVYDVVKTTLKTFWMERDVCNRALYCVRFLIRDGMYKKYFHTPEFVQNLLYIGKSFMISDSDSFESFPCFQSVCIIIKHLCLDNVKMMKMFGAAGACQILFDALITFGESGSSQVIRNEETIRSTYEDSKYERKVLKAAEALVGTFPKINRENCCTFCALGAVAHLSKRMHHEETIPDSYVRAIISRLHDIIKVSACEFASL